jgi:hypothetical protein
LNQDGFQKRVLELWARTRVPLTRIAIVTLTGVPVRKVQTWLDAMVQDELLEVDSDDAGELVWRVPGVSRPPVAPRTVDEVLRLESLGREVQRSTALARRPDHLPATVDGKKSVVASTALSFFLGPLGLLYAAPSRISVPVAVAWLIACGLLPHFMIAWMIGLVHPLSAAAGAYFALDHNAALAEDGSAPRQDR